MTGSCQLMSLKKSHVTPHHLYYSVCSKCPPPAWMQAPRHCHSPAAHSITMRLRAAHSLLTHHFSSSTSKILER